MKRRTLVAARGRVPRLAHSAGGCADSRQVLYGYTAVPDVAAKPDPMVSETQLRRRVDMMNAQGMLKRQLDLKTLVVR